MGLPGEENAALSAIALRVSMKEEPDEGITFEQIFARHKDSVFRLAVAMLGDAAEAEDAVQEIFLRVYRALDRYDSARACLSTWLYRISVNYCYSRLRWRRVRGLLLQRVAPPADSGDGGQFAGQCEAHVLEGERRRAIWQGIHTLGEKHRTVLILHYYMDLPAADIAQVLELRQGTVYSRLHTARCHLRDYLHDKKVTLEE